MAPTHAAAPHGRYARRYMLGLGEIGTVCAERLRDLGFAVSGWSRTRKHGLTA